MACSQQSVDFNELFLPILGLHEVVIIESFYNGVERGLLSPSGLISGGVPGSVFPVECSSVASNCPIKDHAFA